MTQVSVVLSTVAIYRGMNTITISKGTAMNVSISEKKHLCDYLKGVIFG